MFGLTGQKQIVLKKIMFLVSISKREISTYIQTS